jgi:hypothetical protein
VAVRLLAAALAAAAAAATLNAPQLVHGSIAGVGVRVPDMKVRPSHQVQTTATKPTKGGNLAARHGKVRHGARREAQ